jgi:MFS family permease
MERHYSMRMMAFYGSLPFWGLAASSLTSGWLSDLWITRGGSPTRVRKTFLTTGMLAGTLMFPAAIIPDQLLSMSLLIVACLGFGLFSSNLWAVTQTIAGPRAAGKWTGMQNAFGNLAGVAAPWITGWIVHHTGEFFWAFAGVFALLLAGAFTFLWIVGRVEPIDWDAA